MPADAPGGLNEPCVKESPDPWTIADRVGHTDPSFTLRRYSHMFEDQRRAAAVSLDEMLRPDDAGDEETAEQEEASATNEP